VALLGILITTLVRVNRKKEKTNALIRAQYAEIQHKNEELEIQGNMLQETNQMVVSLNANLEEKISERTWELQTTMKELDTFLYRSSHDMRRPLSTLLGLENLAKAELKDEGSLKLFAMMGSTVRSMDRMLRKLQLGHDINRIEPRLEQIDICTLVQELKQWFSELFSGRSFEFELQSGASQTIVSDHALLTIMLSNLLENAGNFRKPDTDPEIVLKFADQSDHYQFTVIDNGIGIDQNNLPHIFDQYFIGTDRSKGNGLGLFLTRKAVDKLNGSIQVNSKYAVGSTFIVTLPKGRSEG
jgi:signal transduction histidine kinase